MKTQAVKFNNIVETIYSLPFEDRLEIKILLEHNIAESRRENIVSNYKKTLDENKAGKLEFSSNINELKKML
jgi:hypothetical protein